MVFVVGGFNDSDGSLKQVESFSVEQSLWRKHSSMNVERINPGCCTFEKQYVYVFGGRSADARADFYDSIERLNTRLTTGSIKSQRRIRNELNSIGSTESLTKRFAVAQNDLDEIISQEDGICRTLSRYYLPGLKQE